jgi:hypothetical protein
MSSSSIQRSTVALGKAYEAVCAKLLAKELAMPLALRGGAHDAGVDLAGTWRPLQAGPYPVIAQCKHYAKKVGPSVLRELEGTASIYGQAAEPTMKPVLALLLSSAGFTPASINRAKASNICMMLLHLEMIEDEELASDPTYACRGALPNRAFEDAFDGAFSVQWKHQLDGSLKSHPSFRLNEFSLRQGDT